MRRPAPRVVGRDHRAAPHQRWSVDTSLPGALLAPRMRASHSPRAAWSEGRARARGCDPPISRTLATRRPARARGQLAPIHTFGRGLRATVLARSQPANRCWRPQHDLRSRTANLLVQRREAEVCLRRPFDRDRRVRGRRSWRSVAHACTPHKPSRKPLPVFSERRRSADRPDEARARYGSVRSARTPTSEQPRTGAPPPLGYNLDAVRPRRWHTRVRPQAPRVL